MIGTLVRKQIREQFAFVYRGKKNTVRSKGGVILLAVVLGISYLSLAAAGVGISFLFSSLVYAGQAWLYFAMLGLMGMGIGLFGSVFVTYSTLYKAKDNDLLLAMPIAPWKILFARMTTVYGSTLLFESVILVPALVMYFIFAGFDGGILIQGILLILASAFFSLTLSCILAYFVALIASHIRNKQIAITILTIVLLGGYYYVYFQINSLLEKLLANSEAIGNVLTKYVFPVYALGRGFAGSWLYTLAFIGITAAIFGLAYFLLSKTFIRLATITEKQAKVKNKAAEYRERSVRSVLLSKELKHLTGSAAYMLNGALGTLVMLIGAVALLLNLGRIREGMAAFKAIPFLSGTFADVLLPLIGAAVFFIAGMNNLAAPSVSIEGKSLWILKSLPISEKEIIRAKMSLHLVLTLPPVILLVTVGAIIMELGLWQSVLVVEFTVAVVFFLTYYGMTMGLRFPILEWDNETVPVKTGAAVTISLFSSWGLALVFGGLYILLAFVLQLAFEPWIYLLAGTVLLAVFAVVLRHHVYTKGTEQFKNL